MPWWGAGTCILVTVRVLLYRFVLTSWGIGGLCVYYLEPCMPIFWVWGFYLRGGACYGYDDYLVWGLCVFEPFLPKRRVLWALDYGYAYFVLVGHGLWVAIGVWHNILFFWAGLCGLKGVR